MERRRNTGSSGGGVMIGRYRFRTIDNAHAFLASGGNADLPIPSGWAWYCGFVVRV